MGAKVGGGRGRGKGQGVEGRGEVGTESMVGPVSPPVRFQGLPDTQIREGGTSSPGCPCRSQITLRGKRWGMDSLLYGLHRVFQPLARPSAMSSQADREGWSPGCVQQMRSAQEEHRQQDIAAQGGQSQVQEGDHSLAPTAGFCQEHSLLRAQPPESPKGSAACGLSLPAESV